MGKMVKLFVTNASGATWWLNMQVTKVREAILDESERLLYHMSYLISSKRLLLKNIAHDESFQHCNWLYLTVPGYTRLYLAVPGLTWLYLAVPGFA